MLHGQRLAQNCMNGLSFKRNWEAAGDWIFHIPWPSVSPRFLPFGCSEIRTIQFRWWCCRVWCHVMPIFSRIFQDFGLVLHNISIDIHENMHMWSYLCTMYTVCMHMYVCVYVYIYIYTYYVYIYIFMNIHILCIYLWMTSNDLTVTSLEWCLVRGVIPKWPNSSAISGWWIMIIQPAILLYDAICTKKEHTHCIAYTSR